MEGKRATHAPLDSANPWNMIYKELKFINKNDELETDELGNDPEIKGEEN